MNTPALEQQVPRHRDVADRLDYLLTLQRDHLRGGALPLLLAIR